MRHLGGALVLFALPSRMAVPRRLIPLVGERVESHVFDRLTKPSDPQVLGRKGGGRREEEGYARQSGSGLAAD